MGWAGARDPTPSSSFLKLPGAPPHYLPTGATFLSPALRRPPRRRRTPGRAPPREQPFQPHRSAWRASTPMNLALISPSPTGLPSPWPDPPIPEVWRCSPMPTSSIAHPCSPYRACGIMGPWRSFFLLPSRRRAVVHPYMDPAEWAPCRNPPPSAHWRWIQEPHPPLPPNLPWSTSSSASSYGVAVRVMLFGGMGAAVRRLPSAALRRETCSSCFLPRRHFGKQFR